MPRHDPSEYVVSVTFWLFDTAISAMPTTTFWLKPVSEGAGMFTLSDKCSA